MINDEKCFRAYPYRGLGYGYAISYAMYWLDPPLQSMTCLVGAVYVGVRVANSGFLAQKDKSDVVRAAIDTFIFEGLATLIVPTFIVQTSVSVCHEVLQHSHNHGPIALLLGASLIGIFHQQIDQQVSRLMDDTIRKSFG